ncbi:hypothetical protein [Kitasatospora sp. NPDC057198]|uniref:hypothetical protein n=1 Tax=Kitasatospora sp. NPDC057198 TaxID=3346046 RepID=UPI00363932BF
MSRLFGRRRTAEGRDCNVERRTLKSRTPDMFFRATFSAHWYPGQVDHRNIESIVAQDLIERATQLSGQWYVEEFRTAHDCLNAELGRERDSQDGYFHGLTATVQLFLDAETQQIAQQQRYDRARVSRLRYLRDSLYSDPELILLDYLDRHPEKVPEVDIKAFQKLARSLRAGGQWWYPLLDALERLSSGTDPVCGEITAMTALLRAFKDAAPELIDKHGLQGLMTALLGDAMAGPDTEASARVSTSPPLH